MDNFTPGYTPISLLSYEMINGRHFMNPVKLISFSSHYFLASLQVSNHRLFNGSRERHQPSPKSPPKIQRHQSRYFLASKINNHLQTHHHQNDTTTHTPSALHLPRPHPRTPPQNPLRPVPPPPTPPHRLPPRSPKTLHTLRANPLTNILHRLLHASNCLFHTHQPGGAGTAYPGGGAVGAVCSRAARVCGVAGAV